MAILAPEIWLASLVHRLYLVTKEPFLDLLKVTLETRIWSVDYEPLCLFYQSNSSLYESNSVNKKLVSQNNGETTSIQLADAANSDCLLLATSLPIIFYVSLCGHLKQVASQPSIDKVEEHHLNTYTGAEGHSVLSVTTMLLHQDERVRFMNLHTS